MNVESIREYCLKKNGAIEDYPFDDETLVIKVAGKMFALISLEQIPLRVNLKCNPEKALELREQNEGIIPGWHMNKKHWNTVILDGGIRWNELREMIDHSYDEVLKGLNKRAKELLNGS